MKSSYRFTILILLLQLNMNAQSKLNLDNNIKRILFIGNSITYSGEFVAYVETSLKIEFPDKQFEFLNLGLPSETVSGLSEPNHADGRFPRPDLHERLERILIHTKPDLIFSCYGMNDGIYLPFDEYRFQKYKDGINWINEQVAKTGTPLIHLTPPIYDEAKGKAYANVLDKYSDWLIDCKKTKGWQVIDLHWPMQRYLEEKRKSDPSFGLSSDGVHPNKLGHWLMAKEILVYIYKSPNNEITKISPYKNGDIIFDLVKEKQQLIRDSWLTITKHKRPGLNQGLPIKEAEQEAIILEGQIQHLLKN